MNCVYNRISEDIEEIEEAKNSYREVLTKYGITDNEINNCDDSELVEMLNELDLYGCGTCFYLVDENITYSELLKVINN